MKDKVNGLFDDILNDNQNNNEISIEDELSNDFLVYATEVNNNRAFPAAADG